ncbi:MAG TPA: hypothetical protein VLB45_05495 [Nitrosopumilaceae archaeon]|nr:hypothetical protein [Nitrosopumilaceae archaeon]
MDATNGEIKKALVSLAVESTLLDMGRPVLEEVERSLYQNYRCYIPDCYEHPEYLKNVLHDLYGASHSNIVKIIQKSLEEFSYQKPIENFLKIISE